MTEQYQKTHFNQAPSPGTGERRHILEGRDFAWWLASWVITGGVALAAQKLGLVNTYADTVESLGHAFEVGEKLNNFEFKELTENSLLLKQAAMGLGLLTGLVTDAVYSGYTLWLLRGKIRLSGNHDATVTSTGVREGDTQCVDNRINAAFQETVDPGSGHMGGWFLLHQAAAQGVQSLWGDHAAADFLTGYWIGRTAPTALLTMANTGFTALFQGSVRSLGGEGPYRDNKLPHDNGCGWTGTVNVGMHGLKFTGQDKPSHEVKIKILDVVNKPAQWVNTAIWEPMMNSLFFVFPGFGTYIINPNFGVQELSLESKP